AVATGGTISDRDGASTAVAASSGSARLGAGPSRQVPSQCAVQKDIMFVLDGSGSIASSDFNQAKNFLGQAVSGLTFGPGAVRGGIVEYSSSPTLVTGLTDNGAAFTSAAAGIAKSDGGTNTAAGISTAQAELAARGRPPADAQRMLILLTDGNSNDRTATTQAAEAARNAGTTILAIGIGTGIDRVELDAIAGRPDRVYTIANFPSLPSLLGQLSQELCRPVTPTPGAGPSGAPLPTPKGCAVQIDLMLVLDGSASIGRDDPNDWPRVVRFARALVDQLAVSPALVRMGIVQFSTTEQNRLEIGLTGSATDLRRTIDNLVQLQGETDIQGGIRIAQDELNARGRPLGDASRVMIVVTDGRANDGGSLADEARNARLAGTTIYAVGVGPDIDIDQLNSMAGVTGSAAPDPALARTLSTFGELIDVLIPQFALVFCPLPEDHAELTSPPPYTQLPCGAVDFAWTPGSRARGYVLRAGSREGSNDLFEYRGTSLSARWSNPPQDGRLVFVDLVTVYDATSQADSYVSTACVPPCPSCPGVTAATPASTPQVLPPARCNDATNSGGAGITTRVYDMGTNAGTFRFDYETFTIPDRIDIVYEGGTIFTTGGFVGENRTVSVTFGPGRSTQITLTVTGNLTDTSTEWTSATCTAPAPAPRRRRRRAACCRRRRRRRAVAAAGLLQRRATNSGGRRDDLDVRHGRDGRHVHLPVRDLYYPGQIDITHEGRVVFTTAGSVGENRTVSVTLRPGASSIITITVTGNLTDTSTGVDTVFCPGSGPGVTSTPPSGAGGSVSITVDRGPNSSYPVGA
ncbi:MAG: VWA domain-containing protein, partial [Dehalococcoidia bacterium]